MLGHRAEYQQHGESSQSEQPEPLDVHCAPLSLQPIRPSYRQDDMLAVAEPTMEEGLDFPTPDRLYCRLPRRIPPARLGRLEVSARTCRRDDEQTQPFWGSAASTPRLLARRW